MISFFINLAVLLTAETVEKGVKLRIVSPWFAPKENYIVTVEADGRVIYSEPVEAKILTEGSMFKLNHGKPI